MSVCPSPNRSGLFAFTVVMSHLAAEIGGASSLVEPAEKVLPCQQVYRENQGEKEVYVIGLEELSTDEELGTAEAQRCRKKTQKLRKKRASCVEPCVVKWTTQHAKRNENASAFQDPSSSAELVVEGARLDRWAEDGPEEVSTLRLPLTYDNLIALHILGGLSLFGLVSLLRLCWIRRACKCKLCEGSYRVLELLGSGGYGKVFLVERGDGEGERFVAKRIPVENITEADDYSREAKELLSLRHKNIVSYEEDFIHTEGSSVSRLGLAEVRTFFFIVMEYCEEGDLKERIEKEYRGLDEDVCKNWFMQLCSAVQYLHSKGVVHRDIKSQNVFLTASDQVRLGDFGLCKHQGRGKKGKGKETAEGQSWSMAGTDCYMAPEMMISSRYGKPADVWSLGCVLLEMLSGTFMWELEGLLGALAMQANGPAQVSQLVEQSLPPSPLVSAPMRSLLKRMLSSDPGQRPTVTEILRKKVLKKRGGGGTFGEWKDRLGASSNSGRGGSGGDRGLSLESFSLSCQSAEWDTHTPRKRRKKQKRKTATLARMPVGTVDGNPREGEERADMSTSSR